LSFSLPNPDALSAHALRNFEKVVQSSPGFKTRAGQHAMAERVADTLAAADFGESSAPKKPLR